MQRRFSWGSTGRATWPRWRSVVLIELFLAIFLIALAAYALLFEVKPFVAKAAMSEALQSATGAKIAILEHLALTGQPLETDAVGLARASEASTVPEYERHLSAALAFAAVAPGAAPASKGPREAGSATQVRYGVRDGTAIVVGRMRALAEPYVIGFSPALATDAPWATVQWVCGAAPVPKNTAVLGVRVPTDVPPAALPHACRGERTP